jgi:hypothetical protein
MSSSLGSARGYLDAPSFESERGRRWEAESPAWDRSSSLYRVALLLEDHLLRTQRQLSAPCERPPGGAEL